jgi:hypothetical protein
MFQFGTESVRDCGINAKDFNSSASRAGNPKKVRLGSAGEGRMPTSTSTTAIALS